MIKNIHWSFNNLPKAKTVVFVLVLVWLSLSTCSKVQYEEVCISPLTYELPANTPFTLMNIVDAPKNDIINRGLKARMAFQESAEEEDAEDLTNADYDIVHIESNYLQLLGPVLFYQKSPINPFDSSGLFLYAEVNGLYAWVSSDGLRNLAYDFVNQTNQYNQKVISESIVSSILLDNKLHCPSKNNTLANQKK